MATDLGGGRYRYVVPAGVTDAGTTAITATADTAAFMAEGYGRVEQRGGALTRPPSACSGARQFAEPVRGRVVERASAPGRARRREPPRGGRRARAGRDPVVLRVRARTGDGRTVSQRREYRVCAGGER